MLIVTWPSTSATHAEIWRLLDLSGMTKSVRQSLNVMKAGHVWVDYVQYRSLRDRIEIGRPYRFEIRWPNGLVTVETIKAVHRVNYKGRTP